jgi:alpha-N-arabinofuranosidase
VTPAAGVHVTGRALGDVFDTLFAANVENVGRGVYGGVWEQTTFGPGIPEAVRRLAPTALRFPGSVSCGSYDWRDGVGPRPRRRIETTPWTAMAELLLGSGADVDALAAHIGPPESNDFGTDEFLELCAIAGAEPVLAVNANLGTTAAVQWIEHCRGRAAEGCGGPVRWWAIGYEPYAPYEPGSFPSGERFGHVLLEYAAAMREADPTLHILAPGAAWPSEERGDAVNVAGDGTVQTMLDRLRTWNHDLLSVAGDEVDAISLHYTFPGVLRRYVRDTASDSLQVMTGGDALGAYLDATIAGIDAVVDPARALPIELREWGWQADGTEILHVNHRLCDALLLAGGFNRMLERPRRVRFAFASHLVNVLSGLRRDGDRLYVTPTYLVTELYRHACRRAAVAVEVTCDALVVPPLEDVEDALLVVPHGLEERTAPVLDAAATADAQGMTVFLGNRSLDDGLRIEVTGLPAGVATLRLVRGDGPYARNTAELPDAVALVAEPLGRSDGAVTAVLPPATAGALVIDQHPPGG